MGEFCILHLSDLHIGSKSLPLTHKRLIEDIKVQTEEAADIIIVVSGDIVDKGEYKYKETALDFFEKLNDAIGAKVRDVQIIPGNHDKKRDTVSSICSKYIQTVSEPINDEFWVVQEKSYFNYLELLKLIHKVFKKKMMAKQTFGVDCCEINGSSICFLKIDTTWGTCGNLDEKNRLVVGKHQLDNLLRAYQELKEKTEKNGKTFALTIAIAHHPTNWLKDMEEELLKKYMIDDEYFNVDLFLCGHIHEMEIENWFNHEHSVMTLVTGIGWNHQNGSTSQKDKKDTHRYSLYFLNLEKNSCEIVMRKTQQNGKFDYDFSIYTKDESMPSNRLCYPIRLSEESYPLIKLNTPAGDVSKNLYINKSVLLNIQKIAGNILEFQKKCWGLFEKYKAEYLGRLSDYYETNGEEYKLVYDKLYDHFFESKDDLKAGDDVIFTKDPEVTYELFTTYLQEISNYFVSIFKYNFEENDDLRVYFRWYNEQNDSYSQLCKYSSVEQNFGPMISDVKWGGMIEKAYLSECSLVYSVNKKYNNSQPINWNDYMTIVPRFFNYDISIRKNNEKKPIKRPMLSFGISVLSQSMAPKDLSELLYVMEFLNLDANITDIIDDFMRCFSVDYRKYLDYLKKINLISE